MSQFRLGHAEVVDIFAEVPGPEFLAVHQSPDASCMLRIYDIRDGAVLYEAWHTGNILDTHWLEKPRRLIVSALGARLDVPGDDDAYSNILFALNPSIHEHGWVRDSREPSEPSVAWYGILGPAQSVALFDPARFHTPEHTEAIGSVVDVGLRLRAVNGVGSVILRLTADGTIVDDACRHNDAYNPMGLPDPTGFDMEMIRVERLDDAG